MERQKSAAAAAAAAAAAGGAGSDDGDDGDDSDDDEAMLARRAPPAASFAYALDPAEREKLEKVAAEALRVKRAAAAAADADKAKDAAARAEAETEKKLRAASLKEAHADAGVAWTYTGGVLVKAVPGAAPPPGAAGGRGGGRGGRGMPGAGRGSSSSGNAPDFFDVFVEIPQLVVGRIIGKAGATIKEITARSCARISVDSGAAGMSVLHAAGRPEALESARMLINNALAPRAR